MWNALWNYVKRLFDPTFHKSIFVNWNVKLCETMWNCVTTFCYCETIWNTLWNYVKPCETMWSIILLICFPTIGCTDSGSSNAGESEHIRSSVGEDYDDRAMTQSFQEHLQTLFSSTQETTTDDIASFLLSFKVGITSVELIEKSNPDPLFAVPISASLQLHSRFSGSEILLQQLACKLAWTESDLAQVVALVSSPHFDGSDVGLDLTRKVKNIQLCIMFHIVSHRFTSFHIVSHSFT